MKKLFWIFSISLLTLRLTAQSNQPVQLALISETDEASVDSDILTAQLSGNQKIHLLERDEIERVYREQGMSAANRDDLKLGRILGADGLLLLDVVRTKQATNLMARLIAVKPGVILTDGSFPWPLKDTAQWTESVSTYLNSFLPKLSLLAKDAIPISVVNLRSAISSDPGAETERQLKLLTIQRLSQEKEFFILERQKMQLLSEEKNLKSDNSSFWNSSYLLEGVVDQNGYSQETVTINARLTPPNGGAPLLFEVSGNRTNLSEVVNQLAAKVIELLKVNSTVPEWNAADEAAQYFGEAQWALRWGVFSEAEAAADSAWALEKHDMDCATVRVRAYLAEVLAKVGNYETSEETYGPGYNADGIPTEPAPSESDVQSAIKDMLAQHLEVSYKETEENQYTKTVRYVFTDTPPNPKNIDCALHALELYYEFSQISPIDNLKVASDISNWKNSSWYDLGIEDLVAASQVLQNFNFVPESQKPIAEKLAELRAMARSVAEWISKSSKVHDSYFVGDRIATHDELANTIEENPNIFRCKVNWGCFWQETPEDGVALYRELMSSPVFCYIHGDFWIRELQAPRLIAWDEADQKRIPSVWNDFIQELNSSTNVLLQLEAKAIKLAEADDEEQLDASFTNLFSAILENHDALVNNNVEVMYLNWELDSLVQAKTSGGVVSDAKDALQHRFYSEYRPKLEAMDQEYWQTTAQGMNPDGKLAAFEKQKQFLKDNKPYDPNAFVQMFIFGFKDYSKTQALEIQPLLAAYKTNLTGTWAPIGAMQVGQVEDGVKRILNPPAPQPTATPTVKPPQPVTTAKAIVVAPTVTNVPEVVTNVLEVNRSFSIPVEKLVIDLDASECIGDSSKVSVTAHHWLEGKLLLDFQYDIDIDTIRVGALWDMREVSGSAIAMFDPATESWNVIACPQVDIQSQNNYYDRTTLFHGDLFTCDGGEIRKYDLISQQWQTLKISDGNNYELFTVNGHLYAANGSVIFEITDGGAATQILASARRRPPVSVLDALDFGTPVLFEGPNHSLRVSTGSKILTWMTNDWHEDSITPPASFPPEVLAAGTLFRQAADGMSQPMSLSFLPAETNVSELYLFQKMPVPKGVFSMSPPVATLPSPKPLWNMPSNLFLANLPSTVHRSDLYLLVDHSQGQDVRSKQPPPGIIGRIFLPKDGYHAALLYYSKELPLAQKLFLKFDAPDSCQPLTGSDPDATQPFPIKPPTWMLFSDDFLFFGLEIPRNSLPVGMPQRIDVGGKASIWLMPVAQIEAARAAQKQIQLEQEARATDEKQQIQRDFLSKYDRNHNGIIDPDEKEAALDDPAFIESELDTIDANHNGWLDADELVYFDANKNKILEPKKLAGIEITQHLLAQRLLKKFDANGDGLLDRQEFNNLVQSTFGAKDSVAPTTPFSRFSHDFLTADDNHDGHVDLAELENYLKEQTRRSLRAHGASATALISQRGVGANEALTPKELFKAIVELYWQQHE
jgi:Ca2+-binding EF-hand superfamily protein